MAAITLKGSLINTVGVLPAVGSDAPLFTLTSVELGDITLESYRGKRVVLNVFPSIDTSVCAASVRRFNKDAAALRDVSVLCISADLPFALARFCGAEGIENVVSLSTFRSPSFGTDYGVTILDGPLKGLLARAVVVIGADGRVVYTELVPEIAQEPNYGRALAALA